MIRGKGSSWNENFFPESSILLSGNPWCVSHILTSCHAKGWEDACSGRLHVARWQNRYLQFQVLQKRVFHNSRLADSMTWALQCAEECDLWCSMWPIEHDGWLPFHSWWKDLVARRDARCLPFRFGWSWNGLLSSITMKVMDTENTQIIIWNMFIRLKKLTG